MAGIAADGAVLHNQEMLLGDYVTATGHGHEDVSDLGGLGHRHHPEAIHHGFHRPDRIHFRDDYPGTKALGPHRDTLSAPSITGHHDVLSGHDEIRGPVYSVPDRLSGTVAVVEKVLAVCVVDQHHRECQPALPIHRFQPQDSCGSLLAASDDVGNELGIILVDHRHQVPAVVYDYVGSGFDDPADALKIFIRSCTVDGEHVQAFVDEGGGYVVLGGQGIASGYVHFRPAFGEDLTEVGCLGLEMN